MRFTLVLRQPLVRRNAPLAAALALLVCGASGFAAEPPAAEKAPAATDSAAVEKPDADVEIEEGEFVRLTHTEEGSPIALETAIVRYVKGEGDDQTVVDLIGAVHVGEKTYYEALNESFEGYETLLYELVADPEKNVPQRRENPGAALSVIGGSQQALQNLLGLEFQLQGIDYGKENFVHADMSPEEFDKTMTERGESWSQIYFRSIGYSAAQGDKNDMMGFEMLGAFFAKNRQLRLKRIFAQQLGDMKTAAGALGGDEGSTILTERNRVALDKLDEILGSGKRSVGVFYGAAHLPDMEKRLLERGFVRGDTKWLEAWDLRDPVKATPDGDVKPEVKDGVEAKS